MYGCPQMLSNAGSSFKWDIKCPNKLCSLGRFLSVEITKKNNKPFTAFKSSLDMSVVYAFIVFHQQVQNTAQKCRLEYSDTVNKQH